jgi:archaellum component FlaF (FlaF/FlaG flagellin family)
MGFSLSAAAAILFTAGLICLGVLLGAYVEMQGDIANAQHDAFQLVYLAQRQHIEILSINSSGEIRVINDGAEVLKTDTISVFVNGSFANHLVDRMEIAGENASKLWAPGEILIIKMKIDLTGSKIMVLADRYARAYGG